MKPITFFSLLLVLFFTWACTGQPAQEQASAEPESTPEATTMEEEAAPAAAFTVTVVNDSVPSPRKALSGKMGDISMTVTYGSPSVKGRTVWGNLVPYGEVWRTGANEATTIEVSKAIRIAGQELPAGTYALFTIPGEADWTVIFNKTAEQWGAYEYNEAEDALRVKVVPQEASEMAETLEFAVEGQNLVMMWEKLMIALPIEMG